MEPSNLFPRILLVLLMSGLESAIASGTSGNETDRIALLDFKNHITQDPFQMNQIMPSWNDSLHFCRWVGVKCNPTNGRVMILNLESQNMFGSIPPSIGNLTFLTGINLTDNNFQGKIPQEIGRLIRLQHLDLSYNSFSGKIPSNISQCRDLTIFRAPKNQLVGQIPEQLSSLSKLVFLGVESNNLSGIIPASIGNLSSLYVLSLMQNSLQGTIPEQIGLLSSLGFFQVSQNGISENGMGAQVSTLGDVYSYGILLLEMFTGKRPTDDIFKEGLSICDFVSTGLLERVREIVDRSLLLEEEEEKGDHGYKDGRMEERAIINDGDPQSCNARSGMVLDCTVSVLRLGLSCSDSLPTERIPMNIVANKMHAIRDSFIRFQKRNRKWYPYVG